MDADASVESQLDDGEEVRTHLLNALTSLPPRDREREAEATFRRAGVPGPAIEHAMQHLIGTWSEAPTRGRSRISAITKGADDFYARQYRQHLNPTMGAFATTATHALIGTGTSAPHEQTSPREVRAAMVTGIDGVSPLHVLTNEVVAVAIAIPRSATGNGMQRWIEDRGELPDAIRRSIDGTPIPSIRPASQALERSHAGSVLDVMCAALETQRLAVLALHPTDPDAMGLHITLFAVEALTASSLASDYGVDVRLTTEWLKAADAADSELIFLVGGTEEVFTQCSQNLFVKRVSDPGTPYIHSDWTASQPIGELLDAQFELLQVTVSSSGLPGASPRNGDTGSVAYVVDKGDLDVLLIPYHPGNFIHGHAAKLWTNPYGAIVVHDDHQHGRTVIMRGPAQVLSPADALNAYPQIVANEIERTREAPGNRQPAYWFEQSVSTIVIESERLQHMALDDTRPTCSISASGQGRHGKKPAYFDTGSLPPYDQESQHRREAAGRPHDPSGEHHRRWLEESAEQMRARVVHLQAISHT